MSSDDQPQLVPYPGLRPFTSEEDYLFFGREEQVRELIDSLQQHRFVAVVGSSGSGKSSLVRCGLLSEIQGGMMVDAGSEWEIAVMQPGGDPLANLAQSLIDSELYDDGDESLHQIMATINRSVNGLVNAVKQSDIENSTNLLLVVDQFEEIFRFHETGKDGDEKAPDFIQWLLHAVQQDEVPIYVVLTMRSDFLGDCSRFTGLAEMINDGEYLVPKLNRDQLLQAIEGPAKVAGGNVNRRLTQRLLNDVGDQADQLPVLQHALMRTWDHTTERHGASSAEMDLEDFDAIGGMENALSTHADEVLAEIQSHHEDLDTDAFACRVFKALTEKGDDNRGIRRPTSLQDLEAISAAPRDLLEEIINAFRAPGRTLLMPPARTELADETVIDISHESLMRVWQQLARWVDDESQSARIYERLADTAALWKLDKAGLYRDPDLQIAIGWMENERPNAAWASRHTGDFGLALDFLEQSDASQHAAEREAEEARERELKQAQELAESQELRAKEQAKSIKRFRLLSGVIGIVALIAIGTSIMAYFAMQTAEENENRATELLTQNNEQQRLLNVRFRADSLLKAEAFFLNDDLYGAVDVLMELHERNPEDKSIILQVAHVISHFNIWSPTGRNGQLVNPVEFFEFRGTNENRNPIRQTGIINAAGKVSIPPQGNLRGFNLEFQTTAIHAEVMTDVIIVHTEDGLIHLCNRLNDEQVTLQELFSDVESFPESIEQTAIKYHNDKIIVFDGSNCWIIDAQSDAKIQHHIQLTDESSVIDVQLTANESHACIVDSLNKYRIFEIGEATDAVRELAGNSNVIFLDWLPLQRKFIAVEDGGLIQLIDLNDPLLDLVLDGGETNQAKEFVISPDSTRLAMLTHAGTVSCINFGNGDYFFEEQTPTSIRFSKIKFDSNGVAIVGLDFERHLIAIDAENGKSLVQPSRFSLESERFEVAGPGKNQTGSLFPRVMIRGLVRDNESDVVVLQEWRLQHFKPFADDLQPDFNQLDSQIGSLTTKELKTLIANVKFNLDGTILWDPVENGAYMQFQSSDVFREINQWFFGRNGRQKSSVDDFEASRDYFKNLAADGKPMPLAQLILCTRAPDELLSAALNMESERAAAGNIAARYHQLHFMRDLLKRNDSPDFSSQLMRQMAKMDNLVEIRSVAYEDQTHEGKKIDLLDAEHIGYWDGMTHRFNIEEGSISTPVLKPSGIWPATGNQYLIWRGGIFSDFRISFDYQLMKGNSGLTIRGTSPADAEDVFGANYLHPYLQQGYQPDFVAASNNFGFSNFAGVLINDNHRSDRPTKFSQRSESALVQRSNENVLLDRRQTKTSDELSTLLNHGDDFASMTVIARGPRIDMFIGDEPLNSAFDYHPLRHLSGMLSFQSLDFNTQLQVNHIEVIPIGRDIAQTELNRGTYPILDPELNSRILFAQRQWQPLSDELNKLENSGDAGNWVDNLQRDVNLRMRKTHRSLARACMENDVETIQAIIDEVGDSDTLNQIAHSTVGEIGRGNMVPSPFMAAAFDGHTDAMALLIENGVSVEKKAGHFQFTPAFAPAISNNLAGLKFLLDHGADPNATNISQFSVLHEATKWSDPELAQALLDAGANINSQHSFGWTALQDVARVRNFLREVEGSQMFEYLKHARSERRLNVARFLVENGTDPTETYGGAKTAIEIAEEAGDLEMVNLLKSLVK